MLYIDSQDARNEEWYGQYRSDRNVSDAPAEYDVIAGAVCSCTNCCCRRDVVDHQWLQGYLPVSVHCRRSAAHTAADDAVPAEMPTQEIIGEQDLD